MVILQKKKIEFNSLLPPFSITNEENFKDLKFLNGLTAEIQQVNSKYN